MVKICLKYLSRLYTSPIVREFQWVFKQFKELFRKNWRMKIEQRHFKTGPSVK